MTNAIYCLNLCAILRRGHAHGADELLAIGVAHNKEVYNAEHLKNVN